MIWVLHGTKCGRYCVLSQFVVKGEAGQPGRVVAGIDWIFNSWGGLYSPCDADDGVPSKIVGSLGMQRFTSPFVLEGGSIHVDGEG